MDNNLPPQEIPDQSIAGASPGQPLSPPPPPQSNKAEPPLNSSQNTPDAVVQKAVNATLQSQVQPQEIDQQSEYPPRPQPTPQPETLPITPPAVALSSSDWRAGSHQSPITSKSFTQKEVKPITWRSFAKMAYIIIFIIGALGGIFFVSKKTILKPAAGAAGDVLLQTPYQPVLWKDFGEVFEPIIEMPLYYPSEGFVKHKFLLDSGALVSSLPREEAKKMDLSLAKLPRSTFGGFGGTTSFAYKGEVKIKLGENEVKIPVVFTEAGGTKSILGRSGFFEKYSIYFNSKREMIEIRK